ncbi:Uncharacterised protein [Bordetella pertussis]|nr:Uncharacterised protein [Bordetella pertussis]
MTAATVTPEHACATANLAPELTTASGVKRCENFMRNSPG